MRKIILILIAILISILVYKKDNYLVIPNDSIRIRVLANSNDVSDMYEKTILKKKLENKVYALVKDANDVVDARNIINNNLDNINLDIKNTIGDDYNLSFGMNYFPKKIYKGVLYNEGYYESLVISLGSGMGNNWWCVLYPPLCLIEDNKTINDVDFRFLIKDIIK